MQKRDLKRELEQQRELTARQAETIRQRDAEVQAVRAEWTKSTEALRLMAKHTIRMFVEADILPELLRAVHEAAALHDSAMLEDVQAAVKNGGMSVQAAVDAVAGECLSWDTLMDALEIDCSDSRGEAVRDELHTRFTLVAQGPGA